MTGSAIRPTWWLDEVYGDDHVFCPRSSSRLTTWLPRDPTGVDNATGAILPVAGALPVVCARGTVTPSGTALLREAGVPVPANVLTYRDEADYLTVVREQGADGRRLVVQYIHLPEDIPPDMYWVPPTVLSRLNNKAWLDELVPEGALAERRVMPATRLDDLRRESFPFVVKAVTDESNGGGLDVVVCRAAEDLDRGIELFSGLDCVVVEEFVPMVANLCIGFIVLPDGRVEYTGAAEQATRDDGRFEGNWLRADLQVPPAAVDAGLAATRAAAERGYRGCAGVDVAVLESGHVVLFDLNFRVNNSSASILLQSSLSERYPFGVARLGGWKCAAGFETMLREAARAMEAGDLIPLGTHDPRLHDQNDAPARLRGLLLGECREEVLEKDRVLAERGLAR